MTEVKRGLNPSQQKLVDAVLDSLDNENIPWNKPWEDALRVVPRNATTGQKYNGSNQIALTIMSNIKGYSDPRWCTFNQAKDKNWRIKKGAKSVQLYYPLLYNDKLKKILTNEDFEGLSPEEVKELRSASRIKNGYFHVFNAQDVIGIPKLKTKETQGIPFSNEVARNIANNMASGMGINVKHGGDRAFYRPSNDSITMPEKNQFKTEAGYYGTFFHEATHATGAEERLNRDLSGNFGSESYSEEELVAEFSSMFLSQDLGYTHHDDELNNNKAYIASWANVIRQDPNIIHRAIQNATKSYKYLYEIGKVNEYQEELEARLQKALEATGEVTTEILKRDVLITEYARDELGLNLVAEGRGIISTKEHDSLKIYTEKNDYYRFSTAKGGDIIDFVMHMEDLDFKSALNKVRDYYYQYEPSAQETREYKKRQAPDLVSGIELPEAASDNKKVQSYLTKSRGLPVGVVNDFIERGLLYQDTNDNCVFVGKLDDVPLYGTRRGAKKSSNFKADVASSIAEVGVYYKNDGNSLILTEGVIDAMSLMTIQTNNKNFDYLSTNGVAKAKQVLNFHMIKREEAQKYERIIIAFDNDKAGEEATNELIEFIKQEYPDIDINHAYPPNSKDWNEELLNMSEKQHDLSLEEPTPAKAVGMSL